MSRTSLALVLATAVAGLGQSAPAATQEGSSSYECCQTLLYPIGARAMALGNALAARPMAEAMVVNPAGLARLPSSEFRVHSDRSDVNNTTTFTISFGVGRAGVAAIGYRLLDWGESLATDENNNPLGSFSITDQMLSASFATTVLPNVDAGVTYKLLQWRLDCAVICQSASGTTNLVDLGLRADVPWVRSLQVGLSATQLGLPVQVENAAQSDPTPTRIRIGAAYEVLQHFRPDSTVQLFASVDVVNGIRAGIERTAAAGLELVFDRALFVRLGYASGVGKGTGGSVGVGLVWERFDVSVAKAFSASDDGTEPFQVTFAISF